MGGCHLACSFCDTDFDGGTATTDFALVEQIIAAGGERTRLAVITGGEPLRQNLCNVVTPLMAAGWHVQFETAGNFWWPWMDALVKGTQVPLLGVSVVCSPKTPQIHPKIIKNAAAFKFIIDSSNYDPLVGLPARAVQGDGPAWRPDLNDAAMRERIWVQACDTTHADSTAHNVRLARDAALAFGYSLSLQTHKIIDVP